MEWAVRQGGTFSESSYDIATDKWGNVFTTGRFHSTADFDPGPDEFNLTPVGYLDIFVSKISPNGELLWAVSVGSVGYDSGYGIATDTFGNVYVTGEFEGTADFDPGPDIYNLTTVPNNAEAFILKLDTDGSFLWATNFGHNIDSDQEDYGEAIIVDDNGDVYTTGIFHYTADFDPGPDTYNLTTNGFGNIFLSKLNSEGDFLWAKSLGGNRFDDVRDIALDDDNHVYITGYTDATSTVPDLYTVKLNSDGDIVLSLNMEGSADDIAVGHGVAIDDEGSIYMTGRITGTFDFDPGPDTYFLSSATEEYYDIFILKLDINGDFLWAKSLGGVDYDLGRSIALDKNNNVYVTGEFEGDLDFDPGPDTHIIYNDPTGEEDAFILKLDTDGHYSWAGSFHGNDIGRGYAITIDFLDNIYTTGDFTFTTDFDPVGGFYGLTSSGNTDNFIQKMSTQPCSAIPTINGSNNTVAICSEATSITLTVEMPAWVTDASYSWNTGETSDSIVVTQSSAADYTVNVTYMVDTVTCSNSASVAVVLADPVSVSITPDAEVCMGDSAVLEAGGGVSYLWSTGAMSSSIVITGQVDQTYSVVIADNYGCTATDSVAISVNPLPEPIIAGSLGICLGDTVSLTATGGESFLWNTGDADSSLNETPLSNTTYSVTVTDLNNCVGVDSAMVVVYSLPAPMLGDDLMICSGDSATLTATGGAVYLWNTLHTDSSIVITPIAATEYTVTVTDNNNCQGIDSVTVFVNELSDTTYVDLTSCDPGEVGVEIFVLSDQNGCDSLVVETTTLIALPETPVAPADVVIQANDPPFEVTISEVPGATEYLWTVPAGVQILSGSATNTILVDWSGLGVGGVICVSAVNECGASPMACMEVTVDIVDATNDIDRRSFKVFPNPSAEFINVKFDDDQIYEIALFDLLGKTVLTSGQYAGQAQLKIQSLPDGNYWLKVSNTEEVFWEQVEIVSTQ